MPQVITTETIVYNFDELSDRAKERARDWFRYNSEFDYDLDDFARICELLGIHLNDCKYTPTGKAVYFSGFCSQGDGACFESTYEYKRGAKAAIKDYAPTDAELNSIAHDLQDLQRRNFYQLQAATFRRGFYYHSGCMNVQVTDNRSPYGDSNEATETEMTQIMRRLADWLYSQLDKQNDYFQSDEYADDCIMMNEYKFTECGEFFKGAA